jgi:hypothetical protein
MALNQLLFVVMLEKFVLGPVPQNPAFFRRRRARVPLRTKSSYRNRNFYWSVPRLATNLLMSGRIDELRLSYAKRIPESYDLENLVAIRLLRIPQYEDLDAGMEEHIWWVLADRIDRHADGADWAVGCSHRPRHDFVARRLSEVSLEIAEAAVLMLTRK